MFSVNFVNDMTASTPPVNFKMFGEKAGLLPE